MNSPFLQSQGIFDLLSCQLYKEDHGFHSSCTEFRE